MGSCLVGGAGDGWELVKPHLPSIDNRTVRGIVLMVQYGVYAYVLRVHRNTWRTISERQEPVWRKGRNCISIAEEGTLEREHCETKSRHARAPIDHNVDFLNAFFHETAMAIVRH